MIVIRSMLWRLGFTVGVLVLMASCGMAQSISQPTPPVTGLLPTAQSTLAANPSGPELPRATVPSQAAPLTPTPSSPPRPTSLNSPGLAVTMADDGKTIALEVGQRFLLSLAQDYEWTVTIDDPSILSRVVNLAVAKGSQGVYEAKKAGTTTLRATGVLICAPGQACIQIALEFQARMVVK